MKISKCYLSLLAAGALLTSHACAEIGSTEEELVQANGNVQFTDLSFFIRSRDDKRVRMMTAMMDGRCHAVFYTKSEDTGLDAPILPDEINAWMLQSFRKDQSQWQQIGPKKWKLAAGPDVPNTLYATLISENILEICDKVYAESSYRVPPKGAK